MPQESRIENPWKEVMGRIFAVLSKVIDLDTESIVRSVEIPPDSALGDLATTIAFQLAKVMKKNPAIIASELVEKVSSEVEKEPIIDRVESKGPYVNIFLNRSEFAKLVIKSINAMQSNYGRTNTFNGKKVLIEFPAVNPSKPWHIGHTRNAVIGDTLSTILEWTGYDATRIDYINDLGLQIAQLTWKLMQEDSVDDFEENYREMQERIAKGKSGPLDASKLTMIRFENQQQKYDHYLGLKYVGVQDAFDNDKNVEQQIREVSRQLEDLNSEEARFSRNMVSRCVMAQNQTAYRLGIFHDYQIWESIIAHSGLLGIAKERMLQAENIELVQDGDKAGCIVAKLDTLDEFKDMKEPNKVLFRSDGTRTYTGADVAFQMWKFGILKDPFKYEPFEMQPNGEVVYRSTLEGKDVDIGTMNMVFNVIGSEQAHPQRLIYTILELLGHEKEALNSHHIAYEFVKLEDVDLSGRKGTWIEYSCDDVLERAKELAREEVMKRNPDESEEFKDEVAEQVGTGAVRYMLLKASPDRKITFRWEEALDFNGEAAPYLQYAHARAARILEKAESDIKSSDPGLLTTDTEFELLKAMARFPEVVLSVVQGLEKNVWGTSFNSNYITNYCYNLATLYSRFYDSNPVLKAEKRIRNARLALVKSFKTTIANCLRILGIAAIERM